MKNGTATKTRRAVTAATPPAPPTDPTPTPAEPPATADDSGWGDPDTVALAYTTSAAITDTGFDPSQDPPMFTPIGAVADLDRPSVEAAIAATLAMDTDEDETEGGDEADGTELCVLVWGDPTKPANLTIFPEDAGKATEPAPTKTAPEAMPSMGLVTDARPDAPAAEPMPDEEGRTIPTPGPLGMWEACLVTEGIPTDEVFQVGDGTEIRGRFIADGLSKWRTPPLPGGFAMDDMGNPADNGHEKAPIACSAVEIVREGNRVMARGPYLDNIAGAALKAAVDGGAPIGPSISLVGDVWDISVDADGKTMQTLLEGTIAGFVVLPYEAQHSTPEGEWLTWFRSAPDADVTAPEGMPEEMPALVPIAASAVVACGEGTFGAPLYPPRSWFETPAPNDGEIVPLTVTDEGQVFGHASGGTCHIGIPGTCLRISDGMLDRDFRVFHQGLSGKGQGIKVAEGDQVKVGQITLAGGHADTRLGAADARKHYDDTDSVIGNVRMTWDPKANGGAGAPWMAGAIQHTASAGQVQQMRAAGEVSVDYRELEDGRLHLIALPVVPRGGFPPLRALSAGGELKTLILTAAGEMAVIGAADLPIAPRDTTWDAAGASKRLASLCTKGDTLDPGCFGRGFFYRDDSQPDTNVGSYKFPFADVINGKLQAVYAGVSAGVGRLGQADIPAADKERIRGKMSAYYARFAKAFGDPSIKPPWDNSKSVEADGIILEIGKDLYSRRFAEEGALLALAHEREVERLAASLS